MRQQTPDYLQRNPETQTLQILQFNYNRANGSKEKEFFEALHPKFQHIIAIQEPQIITSSLSTYTPVRYSLTLHPHTTTRVTFLVSRELDHSTWSVLSLSRDVSCLLVKIKGFQLGIINVYNPGPQSQRQGQPSALPEAQRVLRCLNQTRDNEIETLLLGDFNLHHPRWGGPNVVPHQEASELTNLVDQQGLELLTPVGTVTFERGPQKSTIDLAFASPVLTQRVYSLQTLRDQGSGKDHYPIALKIGAQLSNSQPIQKFAIRKLDQSLFRSLLTTQLQQQGFLPDNLEIDKEHRLVIPEGF